MLSAVGRGGLQIPVSAVFRGLDHGGVGKSRFRGGCGLRSC